MMGDNVEDAPETTMAERVSPARFTADRLVIEPLVEKLWSPLPFLVKRGSDAVVGITVENTGAEAGTFTAALVLDGEVLGWRDVGFAPGQRKEVRFRLGNLSRGTHWVSLAGFTGTFTASRSINWCLIAAAGCTALGLTCILADRLRRTYLR
jgi:hypothetical protein